MFVGKNESYVFLETWNSWKFEGGEHCAVLWQCRIVDHQLCGPMSARLKKFAVFSNGTGYKTVKNSICFLSMVH